MPEDTAAEQVVDVAFSLFVMGGAALVAVVVYVIAVRLVFRLRRTDRFAAEATRLCRWPGRLTVALLAALVSLPWTRLEELSTQRLVRVLGVAAILSGTWFLIRLAAAVEATMLSGLGWDGVEDPDSAFARSRTTRVILLRRVTVALVILVAVGAVLLTFPSVRSLGTSLLASAGILGLVVGIAAQPTLGNLVAGIQLAVAEPFSLDDAVVVEGEWGHIEEVTLTYVVIRLWDRRRLVLPTSYFVNTPFHNWSRRSPQVIGSILWDVDHRTPVEEVRQEFMRLVDAHPLWDGDVAVLQVIEATGQSVQLRGLVTAATAGRVWDLRCAIREGLLSWLVATHPESLPVTRLLEGAAAAAVRPAPPPGDPTIRFDLHTGRSPGPDTLPNPDPNRSGEWRQT